VLSAVVQQGGVLERAPGSSQSILVRPLYPSNVAKANPSASEGALILLNLPKNTLDSFYPLVVQRSNHWLDWQLRVQEFFEWLARGMWAGQGIPELVDAASMAGPF
jgi:hypothetical protein